MQALARAQAPRRRGLRPWRSQALPLRHTLWRPQEAGPDPACPRGGVLCQAHKDLPPPRLRREREHRANCAAKIAVD